MTTENPAGAAEAAPEKSTELVAIQGALAHYDVVEAALVDLETKYTAVVFDCKVPAKMKEALEARAAVRDPRIEVEKVRKNAKAPLLALGKSLDNRAKSITGRLEALEEPIDAQIKAEETRKEAEKAAKLEAEQRRVEAIHAFINEYRAFVADALSGCFNSEQVTDLAVWMAQIVPAEAVYGEFLVNAKLAVSESATALRKIADDTRRAEEEKAANEQMRKDFEALKAAEETRKAADAARLAAEEAERNRRVAAEEATRREQQEREDAARREALAREEQERATARAAEEREMAQRRAAVEAQEREVAARQEAARKEQERLDNEARARREAEELESRRREQARLLAKAQEREAREAEERRIQARADLERMYPYSQRPGRAIIEAMGMDYLETEVMARNVADRVAPVLLAAERFIAGFEGDEAQEGVDELLAALRAVLPAVEEIPA